MSSKAGTFVSRRLALAALAGSAAAGLPISGIAQARPITLRGMVGGGLAHFEASEAQFSLFATRITFNDEEADVVLGSILWVDADAGYTFASSEIADYEILESPAEQGKTRRIRGSMRVNEGEVFPFLLNVTDAGLPATGIDSVALIVGAGAETEEGATPAGSDGFSYAAAGSVAVGDLQDVDFEFGPEGVAS
jgi:hypothetical protein